MSLASKAKERIRIFAHISRAGSNSPQVRAGYPIVHTDRTPAPKGSQSKREYQHGQAFGPQPIPTHMPRPKHRVK